MSNILILKPIRIAPGDLKNWSVNICCSEHIRYAGSSKVGWNFGGLDVSSKKLYDFVFRT